MRSLFRGLASALVVIASLSTPACTETACTTELRYYTLHVTRTFDLPAADSDPSAIDLCIDGACRRAGAPDAAGVQDVPGGGSLTTSAAADGKLVVEATVSASERSAPLPLEIRAHDRAGAQHAQTVNVTFHENADGCHFAPDTLTP